MTPHRHARTGRSTLILLLGLIAAAYTAGAATLWYWHGSKLTSADDADPPPRATNDPVVALGRLKPAGGYLTISGPPGDQIESLSVSLGSVVTVPANAEVAQRAPLVVLASNTERSAEVAVLEKQVQDARWQREVALSSADLQIELAQQKIDELKSVSPLEIDALRSKIVPLEQQRDNVKSRRERLLELRTKNSSTVSQQEIEDLTLAEKSADAELQAAATMVKKAVAGREQGQRAAELQLKTARDSKQRAEKDTTMATLQSKLDLARLLRDRSTLRAPAGSWRVIKVWGQAGEPTAPQQPILQLAAVGPMIAVTEVYETDVQRLRQWMKNGSVAAAIKSRALPSELTGAVSVVPDVIVRNAVMDIDPAADVDRRVFEVQVQLDAKSSAIAAGFLNLQVQVELKPGATHP